MTQSNSSPHNSWLAFVIAAATFFFTMAGTTLPTPLYPIYTDQMQLSQLMITTIFAVYAAGVIAALVISGSWSDQIGRKPVLYAGIIFSILSDVLFCLADDVSLVLIARVVSGLSAGLFASAATAAVIELAPKGFQRAGVLTATAANMGGLGLGPILAGAIAVALPQPLLMPYLAHSGLMIICGLLFLRVPENVKRSENVDLSPRKPAYPKEVRKVFPPAAIAAVAGFMVCGFYSAIIPNFLQTELHLSNHLLVGSVTGFMFIMSAVGQTVVDKIPQTYRQVIGCAVLSVGTAIICGAFWTSGLVLLLTGTTVAGFGHGLAFKSGLSEIGAKAPDDKAAATISSYFIISYISISVPVILVGLIHLKYALKPVSIGFAGLAVVLCLLAMLMILKRQQADR